MNKKPQDLLEFFRRATEEPAAPAAEPEPPVAPEPPLRRMVLVRPSQIVVAGVAALLLVVLAFLVGRAATAGRPEAAGTGVWVIRAITYSDTENGRLNAKVLTEDLRRQGIADVTVEPIPSREQLVVAVGAWLEDPTRNAGASELRDRVRALKDPRGATPFQNADYWRIVR
jgi:hypothetical protein